MNGLQQAISAIKSGNRAKGYRLLVEVIKANPRSKEAENAWLWMSAVVDETEQKIKCLETVLILNPDNEQAKKGLAQLQPDTAPEMPPANLLFLSKFLRQQSLDYYSDSDYWEAVLGETPEQAAKGFLAEGLLEQVGLNELLNYKYKVSELKPMLKQRGLRVSGRKAELIGRLIEADPDGMREAVRGLRVVQCTEQGRSIAEDYLAQQMELRATVEDQTFNALRQGRFKEASEMVAAFEAQQVFARGINIDWKNHDPSKDVAMLTVIFQPKPNILSSLNDEQMGHLRLAAGMKYLWGTGTVQATAWLPSDLKTDPPKGVAYEVESILITEVNRAYNLASFIQMEQLAKDVPGLQKQWIATDDNRTRASHLAAHGQIQDVGEPFIVGGAELMYPGDPAGPAHETTNCRCSFGIVIPEIGPLESPLDAKIQAERERRREEAE